MRALFTLPIMVLAAVPTFAEDPLVVMAADRAGRIEFYSATLGKLGSIGARRDLESASASPDGSRLYIAAESQFTDGKCCGLHTLDLASRNLCFLTGPALFGLPSPDGSYLFTQGAHGVDVFDRGLNRLATMKGAGAYNLQISPDGQWLLGIKNSPKPSLDIFDLGSLTLARHISLPVGPVTGAWAGDRFYIFNYGAAGMGRLWSVNPSNKLLEEAPPMQLPDLYERCKEPLLLMLAGAPDKLFLAEAFGFKVDRRTACPNEPLGGIFAMHLSTGRVHRLMESTHVNRMVVTADGRDLYAIQSSRESGKQSIELLHIDTRSGHISQVSLQSGEWNLSLAHIPANLIPHGNAQSVTLCRR